MKVTKGEILGPTEAHSIGRNYISLSKDGQKCITASEDTFLKIFLIKDGKLASSPATEIEHSAPLCAVDNFKNIIVCGTDDEAIVFDTNKNEMVQTLCQFTLPVRCVAFSSNGKYLAVAADDMKAKLFDASSLYKNSSSTLTNSINLSVPKSPACFVCFSPDEKYLALLTTEGSIVIYSTDDGSEKHVLSNVVKENILPEDDGYSFCFSQDGKSLVIPVAKEVHVYDFTAGKLNFNFKFSVETRDSLQYVEHSASQNHFIAGNKKFAAVVDISSRTVAAKVEFENSDISSVKCDYSEAQVYFADTIGKVFQWNGFIDAKDFITNFNMDLDDEVSPNSTATSENNKVKTQKNEKRPLSELASKRSQFVSEEAENDKMEEDDHSDAVSLDDLSDDRGEDIEDDDDLADFIEYEDGERPLKGPEKTANDIKDVYSYNRKKSEKGETLKLIKPFQPNSTDFSRGLNRRYLVYNLTGIIITTKVTEDESLLDIEFHDVNHSRPIHIKDHLGFTMASLTPSACLFASPYKSDPKIASTLFLKLFDTWANGSDVKLTLDNEDEAIAIALSTNNWFAAATKSGNLHVYSHSGVLLLFISLCLPVVTMNARDDFLIIVYQDKTSMLNYKYQLFDISLKKSLHSPYDLPTTTKTNESKVSNLLWVGFTDNSDSYPIPVSYDDEGVLRMAFPHQNFCWTTVLDTRHQRKGKQDFYWPVGVTEDELLMIVCKAGEKIPTIVPKPILSEIFLNIPYAVDNGEQLREQLFRQSLFLDHLQYSQNSNYIDEDVKGLVGRQGAIDKLLLPQINKACRSGSTLLALDLCNMLYLERSMVMAYNLANKAHEKSLAEKIELIKNLKFPAEVHSSNRHSNYSFIADKPNENKDNNNDTIKVTSSYHTPAPQKDNNNSLPFSEESSHRKTPVPLPPFAYQDRDQVSPVNEDASPITINPFKKRAMTDNDENEAKKVSKINASKNAEIPSKKKVKQAKFDMFFKNRDRN